MTSLKPAVMVDGRAVAIAEVASTARARRRGLLGRDGLDGVLVLRPAMQVHTAGMRFAIDVAFVAADGTVLHVITMVPWRLSRPVLRCRTVIEAEAGAFERWGVAIGSVVSVGQPAAGRGTRRP